MPVNATKLELLNEKHPEYNELHKIWEWNTKLYQGGPFINLINYLPRFYKENENDYKFRCGITPFFNFSKKMNKKLANMALAVDVQRDCQYSKNFEEFVKNVNKKGMNLKNFIRTNIILERAVGKMGVLVDFDENTKKPYLTRIYPTRLINWEENSSGGFNWITIKQNITKKPSIYDKRKNYTSITYWSKDEINKWLIDDSKDETMNIQPIKGYPKANLLKEVPYVSFDNTSDDNEVDYEFYDLNKMTISLTNILSALLLNIPLQNGILVLPEDVIDEVEAVADFELSKLSQKLGYKSVENLKSDLATIKRTIKENSESNGISRFLTPPEIINGSIAAIDALLRLMNEFLGIANLDERNEAAKTKGYRVREMDSYLRAISSHASEKEIEILYFMLRLQNNEQKIDKSLIKSKYETNYTEKNITDLFKELENMGKTILSGSKTFVSIFGNQKAQEILGQVTDDQARQITTELDTIVEKTNTFNQLRGD